MRGIAFRCVSLSCIRPMDAAACSHRYIKGPMKEGPSDDHPRPRPPRHAFTCFLFVNRSTAKVRLKGGGKECTDCSSDLPTFSVYILSLLLTHRVLFSRWFSIMLMLIVFKFRTYLSIAESISEQGSVYTNIDVSSKDI